MSVRNVESLPAEEVKAGTATQRQVLIGPDQGPNFAMRRFIMQPGGGMPMHTNKVEHEQYVLRGSAKVQIGDDTHHVKAGDVVEVVLATNPNAEGDATAHYLAEQLRDTGVRLTRIASRPVKAGATRFRTASKRRTSSADPLDSAFTRMAASSRAVTPA